MNPPRTRPWLLYFRANQEEPAEIPWAQAACLSPEMAQTLVPSLQQFQLGEGATGCTFLELGRRHALATGDPDFAETLALFIAEEQRHSAMLGRYLRSIGASLRKREAIDHVFRRLRKLAGLECMVTVLITAEILAVPYYRAVSRITSCPVLSALCHRILKEEAQHLLFQASTLGALRDGRSRSGLRLTEAAHAALLLGTCVVVWLQHGRVLRRGGVTLARLVREGLQLLEHVQQSAAHPRGPLTLRAWQPSH